MPRDALLLAELAAAIQRILELTAATNASAIEADPDRRDSLLWNFTVLGEAANQVSSALKERHPELPWADASRTRNRLVHGYWSIDVEVLVAIARDDLPAFLAAVKLLVASWDEGGT